MPMYEFRCADCQTKFEELVFATADLVDVKCPSCSSGHVSKQLSAFAVGAGSGGFGGSDYSGSGGGDYGGGCATGGCCSGGSCGF